MDSLPSNSFGFILFFEVNFGVLVVATAVTVFDTVLETAASGGLGGDGGLLSGSFTALVSAAAVGICGGLGLSVWN